MQWMLFAVRTRVSTDDSTIGRWPGFAPGRPAPNVDEGASELVAYPVRFGRRSSVAEQRTHKPLAGGSNPPVGTFPSSTPWI